MHIGSKQSPGEQYQQIGHLEREQIACHNRMERDLTDGEE
jgi:hypothetical protein